MVSHTHAINLSGNSRQIRVFDHFLGLAFKGLIWHCDLQKQLNASTSIIVCSVYEKKELTQDPPTTPNKKRIT